jgi:biotin transport system substrate-specific component
MQTTSLAIERQQVGTQALWIAGFAALTAVGAQVEIPHQPVPFTLQTFFVLLAGAILGKRNGAISMLMYLAVGALGLPVFATWGAGIGRLLGPTGGYLLSFPIAAFAVGYLVESTTSFVRILVSVFIGAFIVFTLGMLQLHFVYYHDWSASLTNGFLIFSWWDLLKVTVAAAICHRIAKRRESQ